MLEILGKRFFVRAATSRDSPRRQPFVALDPSFLGNSLISTFSGIAVRQVQPLADMYFPKEPSRVIIMFRAVCGLEPFMDDKHLQLPCAS